VERRTKETQIEVTVGLDRTAPVSITTGIGFFDHMLEQVARHGGFALELSCRGDLDVDEHHTVEDCALALGQALRQALGDKRGIARYGFLLPMDEALAQVAIDLSGRAYAVFEGSFGRDAVGGLPTELVPHFFRSLADSLGAAIHIQVTRREHAPHGGGVLQGRRPRAAPGDPPRRHRTAEQQGRAVRTHLSNHLRNRW
jgi:imidazoleglycerol-phosphate dehydratase / histidinol-phosphatase